jgi:methyl-accepting chemotaxis protein
MEPTIVSTSTGAIAIAFDYSPYLERIATSLETISSNSNRITVAVESIVVSLNTLTVSANSSTQSLKTITEAATTTGLRSYNAYDWIKPLEMISWYTQGYGVTQYSSAETDRLLSVINSLTNRISKFE